MFHNSDGGDGLIVPAGFHIYQRTATDDAILVQLYAELVKEGSLDYLFYDATLSGMFRALDPLRAVTLLKLHPSGTPWLAAWFEQCFDGAYLGLWGARSMRHTKEGIRAVCAVIDAGLEHRCCILGTTRPELIDDHKRLGYTELGTVPALWDSRDVCWVYVTRDAFEASKMGRWYRRQQRKE